MRWRCDDAWGARGEPGRDRRQRIFSCDAGPAAAGGLAREEIAEDPSGAGDSSQGNAADNANIGEFITSRRDGAHGRQTLLAFDGSAKSVTDKSGVRFNLISIVKDNLFCLYLILWLLTLSCEQTNNFAVPYVISVHGMQFNSNTTHSQNSTLLQPSVTRSSTNVIQMC